MNETNPVPNWDSLPPKLSWKDKVAYMAYALSLLPQREGPLEHLFPPGVYIREMRIPAGTLVISRIHLLGHIVQLTLGEVVLVTPQGRFNLKGPVQVHTNPGDQLVCYTVTDILVRTIHPNVTESRDIELLEKGIFGDPQVVLEMGKKLFEHYLEVDAA